MFDHYEYTQDPTTKVYHFDTDKGIHVKIIILRDKSWYPYNPELTDVFTFDLETEPRSHVPDYKIRNTVATILSARFINTETIILFHCDNEDGKESKRKSVFDRWHKIMNNESIHKHDKSVIFTDIEVHASILIHKDNSHYDRAVGIFNKGDIDVTEKFSA